MAVTAMFPNNAEMPSRASIELPPTPLQLWVDELEQYEAPGVSNDFKIIDSNGKYSYGCLQFQYETFRAYVRAYHLLDYAEDAELYNFIGDCDFQHNLAELMIQEDPRNWTHWYTSVKIRGLGYPPSEE